ncbi:VOC family protein [Nocardia sp. NPDC050630]|uniref:VOC family protein n=1 Tax=Nocardia sp. NPDC050630 TaxID=3364321 RepID=UPI003792230C
MMRAEDQFHVGIVAVDFEATLATLSAVLGSEWGPEVGGPVAVRLPGREAVLELKCRYSTTVPRLEVVRSVAGTLWEPVRDAGIHHIGYWSDDVVADVVELESHGYLIEATRAADAGRLFFAFLRAANGFRVELVDRSAESGLSRCWAHSDIR